MISELPVVSVIMPAFNGEKYITQAIQSALDELGQHDELLLVDNASTDATARIVKNIEDPRIRYLYESKKGPAAARNHAFRHMRGEFVAFLDCDDLWPKGRQQNLLNILQQHPGVNAVYGRIKILLDGVLDSRFRRMDDALSDAVHLSPFLFRRSLLERCGGMDETLLMGEDVDYLARLREGGMVAVPWDGDAFIYRRHDANATTIPANVNRGHLDMLSRRIARRRAPSPAPGGSGT